MLDRIKNSVIDQWLGWLVALIGAAMLAVAKVFWAAWADAILYGIVAFASFVLILISLRTSRVLARLSPPLRVTTSNIEQLVRGWLDMRGFGVQRKDNDATLFYFTATTPNKRNIGVFRQKKMDQYIGFHTNIHVGEIHKQIYDALPANERVALVRELRMKIAAFKIGFSNINIPLERFSLLKQLPITADLTEHDFIQAIDEVELAQVLAIEFIVSRLQPLTDPVEVPTPTAAILSAPAQTSQ